MYVYYRCCCGLVAKSCRLFCYPWTSLSVGVLRQEYWSGEPFPSPGDLPNPGVKLMSPALAGEFFFMSGLLHNILVAITAENPASQRKDVGNGRKFSVLVRQSQGFCPDFNSDSMEI